MNKNEFMSELKKRLKKLPYDEINNAVLYYEEYFQEAGVDNEETVIAELGSPSDIASKIIGEFAIKEMENKNTKKSRSIKNIWLVVATIFASPIALPLALAVLIVIFSLAIVIFALFFSFWAVSVALALSGGLSFILSFIVMTMSLSTGLFYLGTGLFFMGIGVALFIGVTNLFTITMKSLIKVISKYLIRRGTK